MPDRDHLDQLKAAADPQRVADALGLRGRGKRFFCPACQSDGAVHRTPDLAVGDKGFTCHKCGEKGDVLQLVQLTTGLDFAGAVRWLEDHTGIGSPAGVRKGGYPGPGSPPIARPGPSWKAAEAKSRPVADLFAHADIYAAFLDACRPVEGKVLDWLTKNKGVAAAVIDSCRLRFCGREYQGIIDALTARFGLDALIAAGLRSKATERHGGTFYGYIKKGVGFVVIPYLAGGRPVYLKVRPPIGKAEAERREVPRFLNTGAEIPCLYNLDALSTSRQNGGKSRPARVLVCEGESDTWTALSAGYAAVGVPGANNFKPEWAGLFRGFVEADGKSAVYLVFDTDAKGIEGSRIVADIFWRAGLPVPRRVIIPDGKDLNDFMKGGLTS